VEKRHYDVDDEGILNDDESGNDDEESRHNAMN